MKRERESFFVITEVSENISLATTTTVIDLEDALAYLEDQGYNMIDDLVGEKHRPYFGVITATITQELVVDDEWLD